MKINQLKIIYILYFNFRVYIKIETIDHDRVTYIEICIYGGKAYCKNRC